MMISLMLSIIFWMSCVFFVVCDHHCHDSCHYILIVAVRDVIYDLYPKCLTSGNNVRPEVAVSRTRFSTSRYAWLG